MENKLDKKIVVKSENPLNGILFKIINEYRSLLILLVMLILATFLSTNFLSTNNLINIIRQISISGIVGAGMTFVILTGGIDLSVGSIVGLSGVISASIMVSTNNIFLSVASGLLVGLVCGFVNGFFIAKLRIPAFIVTLGMMTLLRGVILVYTKGSPIPVRLEAYQFIGKGAVMGIPMPVILLLTVFLIGYFILHHTTYGREIYAIGGNREATRLSGINVVKTEWGAYLLNGVLSAIAGIVLTARLGSAQSTGGSGIEMDAIAAVILGGTSLSGGSGFILPTVIGAIILGLIDNILTLMNVNPHATQIVKGAVIIVAIVLDKQVNEWAKKNNKG